jgi:hypothetical protein
MINSFPYTYIIKRKQNSTKSKKSKLDPWERYGPFLQNPDEKHRIRSLSRNPMLFQKQKHEKSRKKASNQEFFAKSDAL